MTPVTVMFPSYIFSYLSSLDHLLYVGIPLILSYTLHVSISIYTDSMSKSYKEEDL